MLFHSCFELLIFQTRMMNPPFVWAEWRLQFSGPRSVQRNPYLKEASGNHGNHEDINWWIDHSLFYYGTMDIPLYDILLWIYGYVTLFYYIYINTTLDDCATIFLMSCSWQSKEYWTAGKRIQVHDGSTLYTQPLGEISQFYGCTGERSWQEGYCWWKQLTEATHHPSDCCHMLSHEWVWTL